MQKFFFTFGSGSPLARYYVVIEAADEEAARLQMFCWFTRHWSHCYTLEQWGDQATRYGLMELIVPKASSLRLMTNTEDVPIEIGQVVWHSGRVAKHARGDYAELRRFDATVSTMAADILRYDRELSAKDAEIEKLRERERRYENAECVTCGRDLTSQREAK